MTHGVEVDKIPAGTGDLARFLGGSSKLVGKRRRRIRRQRDAENDVAVPVPCVYADELFVLAVVDGPRYDVDDLDPDAEELIAFEFDDGYGLVLKVRNLHVSPPSAVSTRS